MQTLVNVFPFSFLFTKYQGAAHGLNTLDSQWQHVIQADDLR
jgi:hypothetical protein